MCKQGQHGQHQHMYRCRWTTNMVTMYCRGWPTFRNAAYQQHFRHQPTVKRKVERGVPNATNSLTPEDPGSILAIVSMRIRTGWLGHSNQVHIPTIAKVSDPSAVKTCKGTMIFPRTICSLEKRLRLLSRHEPAQTWNKNTFHQIQG